jgi:hypothetical protein
LKVLLYYLWIETIMEGRDTYIMGWVRKHWGNERLQKIRCKGNPSSCRSSRLYYKVSRCMCGCEREMLGSLETVLSFAPLPIIYRRIPWAWYFFNESVCSIF